VRRAELAAIALVIVVVDAEIAADVIAAEGAAIAERERAKTEKQKL
jgi:hypothetical protein